MTSRGQWETGLTCLHLLSSLDGPMLPNCLHPPAHSSPGTVQIFQKIKWLQPHNTSFHTGGRPLSPTPGFPTEYPPKDMGLGAFSKGQPGKGQSWYLSLRCRDSAPRKDLWRVLRPQACLLTRPEAASLPASTSSVFWMQVL